MAGYDLDRLMAELFLGGLNLDLKPGTFNSKCYGSLGRV